MVFCSICCLRSLTTARVPAFDISHEIPEHVARHVTCRMTCKTLEESDGCTEIINKNLLEAQYVSSITSKFH
jgi:hypothetical protein